MKALREEAEKAGIESEKVQLASVEKTGTKKKVRIVKKIVKKKVLKKVPKRVSVASQCNDLENVATPNPNDNSPIEIQASLPVEIDQINVSVNDVREDENTKEIDLEKVASDCSDLEKVAIPNPNDNTPIEIQASVPVEIDAIDVAVNDIREVENTKEFQVSDKETEVGSVENRDCCRDKSERSVLVTTSLSDDQKQIEFQEHDISNMDIEDHAGNEVDESLKEHSTECEEDMEEQVDLKPSSAVEDHEGMKEIVVNNETDDFESQMDSSEIQIPSTSHLKHMTKIFIHGLDKETNEEDIRKVFEEVGEVVEVKIITNFRSGKSRGCGFIRYSSPDLAKLALKKYNNVEICGKVCRTAAVDGSDTILLNNINKNWNNEHVLTLLQKIGIKNIDEVTVVPDPKNPKLNRGFAYLELETKRDAQIVYQKLQNKNIFGNNSNIKVTWAKSLPNPVEEEIHTNNNVNNNSTKSVYVENLPSTWDEKEVRGHFGKFGEIESIALAKNLRSSKRNDFAFVNYKTCEGAHSCVEVLTSGKSTGVKVSLSRTIPKVKPVNGYVRPHKGQIVSGFEDGRRKESSSSTTDELLKLLREQATWKHGGPSLTQSHNHHHQPSFERESLYHDPRAYHQPHFQTPNVPHLRSTTNGANMRSFPHFDPQHARYTSGSFNAVGANNPSYFQTRDQASYHGSGSSVYRQMR